MHREETGERVFLKVDSLELLGLKIGGGLVGGAICGFLIKQFVKFLAFLLAVYFGSLAYLAYRDYIHVRWNKLFGDLTSMSMEPYLTDLLDFLVSIGFISASFITGFYIGDQENLTPSYFPSFFGQTVIGERKPPKFMIGAKKYCSTQCT